MIPFWKYHGLGNDFVILDAAGGGRKPTAAEARWLCDRRRGVGADGVLTLLPSQQADARLHLYNADGSEPEMCGNGLRCLVKFLLDRTDGAADEVRIETPAGIMSCHAKRGADGRVETVTVDLGPVRLERSAIPMAGAGRFVEEPIESGDIGLRATAVCVGVPHLVLFTKASESLARKIGPPLENHRMFPHRINVDLAEMKGRGEMNLVVWERGCGLTLACGTGACASAAAACLTGRADFGEAVRVNLPGGTLTVEISHDLTSARLSGPAEFVFRGELERLPNTLNRSA